MPHRNIIEGTNEETSWNTIAEQLNSKEDKKDYTAQFDTGKHCVTLHIDILPGSRDEDGKAITSFTAPLPEETKFRFRIEKQNFKHGIRKLFGMQDVIIGQKEFDDKFLIQSNDEVKVKQLLSKVDLSNPILNDKLLEFEIREQKIGAHKEIVLALDIEEAITDPAKLKEVYQPFKLVLSQMES